AEVVDRGAEVDGDDLAAEKRGVVELRAGAGEQLRGVAQVAPRRRADLRLEARVVEAAHRHRRDRLAMRGALEAEHALVAEVEHALERRAAADRPVHRHGADAELALDLADELER